MNTTGLFSIHQFEIPFTEYNKPIYLFPFGDIHRYARLCHEEKWKGFLSWAKGKKNAYFLGVGDYDDLASTTERKILGNIDLHESTKQTIDDLYLDRVKRLSEEIGFMRGRLIGLINGNHYGTFSSGITTDQKLAEILKTTFLGCSSFIRLSFVDKTRKGHVSSSKVDIWAHHGRGASRLRGGSINRVQQMMEAAEADIFIMGHDHQKSAVPGVPRLYLSGGKGGLKLHQRKTLLVRSGSFLKGYVDGEVSYIADGAMNPTDLGVVKIEMTPRRITEKRNGRMINDTISIDLHSST